MGEGGQVKNELQTSTYQMLILMLFNQSVQLTYQQLLTSTQIGELDMKCNLIPLLQLKLLIKANP